MSAPDWSDRQRVNEIGADLASLRMAGEGLVIIGYGAHAPSIDCRIGSVSATVQRDGERATAEAVSLQDALYLARAKVASQIAARDKKRAEEVQS